MEYTSGCLNTSNKGNPIPTQRTAESVVMVYEKEVAWGTAGLAPAPQVRLRHRASLRTVRS